jgi:hypothetical protein
MRQPLKPDVFGDREKKEVSATAASVPRSLGGSCRLCLGVFG